MRAICIIMFLLGGLQLQAQESLRLARPMVKISPATFTDSTLVRIEFGMAEAEVQFQVNSGEKMRYAGPFWLHETSTLEVEAQHPEFESSVPVRHYAVQVSKVPVTWLAQTAPADKYPNSGAELLDLTGASPAFSDSAWCGYESDSVLFRFRCDKPLSAIGYSTLRDEAAWILPPAVWKLKIHQAGQAPVITRMEEKTGAQAGPYKCFALSDALTFSGDDSQPVEYELVLFPTKLPPEHPGAGRNAWIFLDELILHP